MAEQQDCRQRRSRRATLLLAFAALAMERADAALLARYNAIRVEAGPLGGAAYARAKAAFFIDVLGR